jgi:hypothetical protein
MRPFATFACIGLFFCAAGAVQAQTDNRTMLERFTSQPDQTKAYQDPNLKPYGSSKSFPSTENRMMKAFPFIRGFQSRSYATTSYNASNFWAGNFKFKTTDANLDSHSPLTSLIRMFKTKSAETRTAAAASKTFPSRPAAIVAEKSKNIFPGKLQKQMEKLGPDALTGADPLRGDSGAVPVVKVGSDPEPVDYAGGLHPLTLEEVRELLGKSK